jgi:hypothetical protein
VSADCTATAYTWSVPDREADDLIEQIAGATARLIESNAALARRLLCGAEAAPDVSDRGPVEDAWLTWADCAGDLVTVSYLSAQLADVLGVFPRPSSARTDADN